MKQYLKYEPNKFGSGVRVNSSPISNHRNFNFRGINELILAKQNTR